MKKLIILIITLMILFSCQQMIMAPETDTADLRDDVFSSEGDEVPLYVLPKRISFDEFHRAIPIPETTEVLQGTFNEAAVGTFIAKYTQPDLLDTLDGYVTDNQAFFDQVLEPAIAPYLDSLKSLQKYQALNALALFIYESYQDFIGDSFYRWGGDITDRDQPQPLGHTRSNRRYGMDCSGFGASPYEVAVQLEILDSTDVEAAFSWMGFKYICDHNESVSDGGGRNKRRSVFS